MATVYETFHNTSDSIAWDDGEEYSRDEAKEILMATLESYDGFLKCVVTPDKSWTLYLDEDDDQPVIAVKW